MDGWILFYPHFSPWWKNVKNHFRHRNSETIAVINLKFGTDIHLKSSKMNCNAHLEFHALIVAESGMWNRTNYQSKLAPKVYTK